MPRLMHLPCVEERCEEEDLIVFDSPPLRQALLPFVCQDALLEAAVVSSTFTFSRVDHSRDFSLFVRDEIDAPRTDSPSLNGSSSDGSPVMQRNGFKEASSSQRLNSKTVSLLCINELHSSGEVSEGPCRKNGSPVRLLGSESSFRENGNGPEAKPSRTYQQECKDNSLENKNPLLLIESLPENSALDIREEYSRSTNGIVNGIHNMCDIDSLLFADSSCSNHKSSLTAVPQHSVLDDDGLMELPIEAPCNGSPNESKETHTAVRSDTQSKLPPISTISEFDEEDDLLINNGINSFTFIDSISNRSCSDEESKSNHVSDAAQNANPQAEEDPSREDFTPSQVTCVSFHGDADAREAIGRVFVLDDEVDEWIDGPFEAESDQTSDDSSGQEEQSYDFITKESEEQNDTEEDTPLNDHLPPRQDNSEPPVEEQGTTKGLYISESAAHSDNQPNGHEIEESSNHVESPLEKEELSTTSSSLGSLNSQNSPMQQSNFKTSRVRRRIVEETVIDDVTSSQKSDSKKENIWRRRRTKSLLKKGPSSGARVTFNTNKTIFSEAFPEGESVAIQLPFEVSPKFNASTSTSPIGMIEDLISDDLLKFHWLEFMMEDPTLFEKQNGEKTQAEADTNDTEQLQIDEEEEEEEVEVFLLEPTQIAKENDTYKEEEIEEITETEIERNIGDDEETDKDSNNRTVDFEEIFVDVPTDSENKNDCSKNDVETTDLDFYGGDFRDQMRLSKQCQLSPTEVKDNVQAQRSNQEVRQSIELSALRRSLIRSSDIKRRPREKSKPANEDQSLMEKLRLLTEDCGDSNPPENDSTPGKKDELETFVQQSVPRLEKIKKRYSLTEDPSYGFTRLPSVRGIRPRYGTTNEILQQLQSQIQMHPLASSQGGPITWPYIPDSKSHPTSGVEERADMKENGIVSPRERAAYHPDCKLRPKRGREGLSKHIASSVQYPPSKEERGAPEGASSSPKIMLDGWNPYQRQEYRDYHESMKTKTPVYHPPNRPLSVQSPYDLQPVYEVPYNVYHQPPTTYSHPSKYKSPPPYEYHHYHRPPAPRNAKDPGVVYYQMSV